MACQSTALISTSRETSRHVRGPANSSVGRRLQMLTVLTPPSHSFPPILFHKQVRRRSPTATPPLHLHQNTKISPVAFAHFGGLLHPITPFFHILGLGLSVRACQSTAITIIGSLAPGSKCPGSENDQISKVKNERRGNFSPCTCFHSVKIDVLTYYNRPHNFYANLAAQMIVR